MLASAITVSPPPARAAEVGGVDHLPGEPPLELHGAVMLRYMALLRVYAAALGVGLALPILGAVGYRPGVEQTPQVELAPRTMYAQVSSLCNGVALVIALYYPIDQGLHSRILEGIALRREDLEGIDPLAQPT